MQPTGKTIRFEDVFPYMGVTDDGVMVTKKGALSVGWELSLPVLHTLSEEAYDNMIQAFGNAVRVMPAWTIIHRQDLFYYDEWAPAPGHPGGFLSESFERHHAGRRFLTHKAYLFFSMASKGTVMKQSLKSGLFGVGKGFAPSRKDWDVFLSKVQEFATVFTSGCTVKMRRLTREDIIGTKDTPGIISRYILFGDKTGQMSDIVVSRESVSVFRKQAQAYSVCRSETLPPVVSSVRRVDVLSQDNNVIYQSLGASLGVSLDCEHVVNSYIIVPDQEEEKERLLQEKKKMEKGIDVNENAISAGEIQEYINRMYNESPLLVKASVNVIAWDDYDKQTQLQAKISSAVSSISTVSAYVKYNTPMLWYAGMPGNATELGTDNMMTMELTSCLCLQNWDTFQFEMEGGMLRICDRVRHQPIVIDTQKVAQALGFIFDLNAFVLGPSGTGKSFFVNYYLENCYNAKDNVFIIDVGNSYEGLCSVIAEESGGRDGQYMSWDADHPLTFNPFIGFRDWLDDNGNVRPDSTGANFFISVLETIWEPLGGWSPSTEPILKQTVSDFVSKAYERQALEEGWVPVFDDYYLFLSEVVEPLLADGSYQILGRPVGDASFDMAAFLRALSMYSMKGTYGFLLNSTDAPDLFRSRFVVFEVSKLSQVKDQKFYSLCILCIMNSFDMKMRETTDFDVIVIEEAWKAIANETMEPYLRELWKTARKYNASAVVVTQQASDITSSPIIKDAILKNSSTKILLNQYNNKNDFDVIAEALSLTKEDVRKIFSMDLGKDPRYRYRDVFIKLGESFSGVFSTEVSREEAIAFESAYDKKEPFLKLMKKTGSAIEAIKTLCQTK